MYQHLEYFAFGETFVEEHSNTDRTPYLFNGKELDEETGLYYYGARYYDARTSVWMSVDPLAEQRSWVSPYNYVQNNPLNRVDPDGALDTELVNTENGKRTNLDDGKDQVVAVNTEQMNQMQSLFSNDRESYNSKLGELEGSSANLKLTSAQFQFIAETVYAESNGGLEESQAIVNVLENRAQNQGTDLMTQLSDKSPYGVYGIRKTGGSTYKFSYNNEKGRGADIKRSNVHRAIALALSTDSDLSGGGFFWDGRDFNGKNTVNGGYRKRYGAGGYLFTSPAHDLWKQGNYEKNGSYLYESTAAVGATTFSKFNNQGSKWYISK